MPTLLFLGLSYFLSAQEPNRIAVKSYTTAEAYEVYSTILPTEWTWREANNLVIRLETVSHQMCLVPAPNEKKTFESAIANFQSVNAKAWRLERKFNINKPYQIIPSDTLLAPFKDLGPGGWPVFDRLHKGSAGWIEFSAVGFNENKTIAVVYMAHSCGSLCGGGTFHVLRKSGGKWEPVQWSGNSCAWAS